jgi:RNA polymerase sigma factor (sigma-70 family)
MHRFAGPGACPWTDAQLLDAFFGRHDESAFAALVDRYGRMVLRVCRRVLGHEQDAEDAFQATFLVLARGSGLIRQPQALAGWLYGVAYRTALKAKRTAARRRHHESRLPPHPPQFDGPRWEDVQAILNEEIERLPDPYRAAFVLCSVEGKSCRQAATALGVKAGTVLSRVARARQRLRGRLTRRGIELGSVLAALSVANSAAHASVPAILAKETIRSGFSLVAGNTGAVAVSAPIAALASGVTRTLFLTKAKIVTALVFAFGLLAAASVLTHGGLALPQGDSQTAVSVGQQADTKPLANKDSQAIEVGGRVLDPDGKPVRGARIYQALRVEFVEHAMPPAPRQRGTSDADGRFHFAVAKADLAEDPKAVLQVVAVAEGFGPGWADLEKSSRQEWTLRLAKDDVPIKGRILDLEGRPVKGATIQPMGLMTTPAEDLSPWLQAIKDNRRIQHREMLSKQLLGLPQEGIPGLPRTITTDADGRFRLTGVGRERALTVMIGGPRLTAEPVFLITRDVPKFQAFDNPSTDDKFTVYGASFEHFGAPAKPVTGTVRDKDTGKPLAGVKINLMGPLLRATTDKEGKFQLDSLPAGLLETSTFGLPVLAIPPRDQPYLVGFKEVRPGLGLKVQTLDFELKRGVWVEGKVTNKDTGKPVRAHIVYHVSPNNPHRQDAADFARFPSLPNELYPAAADGSFRVPVLPGPGQIIARGPYGEYIADASAAINPTSTSEPVRCDLVLDPGRTLTGTVQGPDGKPLAGCRLFNLKPHLWTSRPQDTASFSVSAIDPRKTRSLVVLHPDKRLVKAVELDGSDPDPLIIHLESAGTVTGRLLDEAGQPRPRVELIVFFQKKDDGYLAGHFPERVTTDGEGRFRVENLAPGLVYQINEAGKPPNLTIASVATRLSVKAGELKDLGGVTARRIGD